MKTETDLTVRKTVTECVAEYEAAVAEFRTCAARIAAAEERLNNVFTLGEFHHIHLSRGRDFGFANIDAALYEVRRACWEAIIERTEVRRMLSIQRAKQLDEMLKGKDLPEITVQSVQSMVESLSGQLPELLEEAVVEVFEMLRPRRRRGHDYKTNSDLEIGPRVILSHMVEHFLSHYSVAYYGQDDKLRALENVFTALDGKGQMSKQYHSAIRLAIQATPTNGDGRGETDYFRFRCCRNGNLHLEFRRPDLLKRLNQIAGGKRLRPSTAA